VREVNRVSRSQGTLTGERRPARRQTGDRWRSASALRDGWIGCRRVRKLEGVGDESQKASARRAGTPTRNRTGRFGGRPSRNREWMPLGSSGNEDHAASRDALRPWKPTSFWKRSGSCSLRSNVRPRGGARSMTNRVALPAERRRGSSERPFTRVLAAHPARGKLSR
jgi:hypothetical protein